MKTWKRALGTALLAIPLAFTASLQADESRFAYEVTITNITKGEIFTPIMVATHPRGVKLFETGSPASAELEMLAEGGDTGPLSAELLGQGALDVTTTAGVLPPGQSVTVQVSTNRHHNRVSVAAMLVPTNDAFFAVNGMRGPKRLHRSRTVYSPAYDAGTEINDELCVSIPGPPFICAGEGFNPDGGEGYVYIHAGIQGNGDLVAADLDWRNPVAKISIRKIRVENDG